MISKNHYLQSHVNRGFTLLELIITLVLVGIAGSLVIVGFSSLSGMGQERKTIKDAQLAQERLELILAEKRHSGFPNSTQGVGPDPCQIHSLPTNNFPSCNGSKLTVSFSNQSNNPCYANSTTNCTINVSVDDGPDFIMVLYNFE